MGKSFGGTYALVVLDSQHPISAAYATDDKCYYNKEYQEGFPRGFILPAAAGIHQSRRLRWIPTAKGSKSPRGISQRYFFILSAVPRLRNDGLDNGCSVFSNSKLPVNSFVRKGWKDAHPGVSFQCFRTVQHVLWQKPTNKSNSPESCFSFRTEMPTVRDPACFRSFF